jgi:hypothetical protein
MIDFSISKTMQPTSNTATIGITNPSQDTIAALQKEGVVTLKAGYKDDIATILVGSKESIDYFDDGSTKRIVLTVLEGSASHTDLIYSSNFYIGASRVDIVRSVVDHILASVPSVTSADLFTILDFTTYQKPQVFHNNAFKILSDLLEPIDYKWFVQKGNLSIIANNSFLKDAAVPLHSDNGMIGTPKPISETDSNKITRSGVECRSILNYNFDVGRLLILNSKEYINESFRMETINITGNSFEGDWMTVIKAFEVDQ